MEVLGPIEESCFKKGTTIMDELIVRAKNKTMIIQSIFSFLSRGIIL